MRRVNIYRLLPDAAQQRLLRALGDRCAALWNVAQYQCRHACFAGERVPSYSDLCATLIGHAAYRALPSDIAQEVLKKVAESWKSSHATLSAHTHGTIKHKPSLPGYWKDRKTGHRLGKCIPIKCARAYRISAGALSLVMPADLAPGRLTLPLRGEPRWTGQPGRAEILYDAVRRRFYLHASVDVAESERALRADRWAAIDPGARMTVAVAIEGTPDATLYRSRELWKDFRYWDRRIAALQSQLAPRGFHTSRRLRRCYQQRQARLQAGYRALARTVVDQLKRQHVTDVALEDQTGIRDGLNFGRNNALIHNFWAFAKMANALEDACERADIRIHPVPRTDGASIHCALCAEPTAITRSLRSRVHCKNGHRLHADTNAAWNLLASHSGTTLEPGVRARAAGRPRWTTHRWNSHRWVATESRQSADLARVA
jgi:putative transposase